MGSGLTLDWSLLSEVRSSSVSATSKGGTDKSKFLEKIRNETNMKYSDRTATICRKRQSEPSKSATCESHTFISETLASKYAAFLRPIFMDSSSAGNNCISSKEAQLQVASEAVMPADADRSENLELGLDSANICPTSISRKATYSLNADLLDAGKRPDANPKIPSLQERLRAMRAEIGISSGNGHCTNSYSNNLTVGVNMNTNSNLTTEPICSGLNQHEIICDKSSDELRTHCAKVMNTEIVSHAEVKKFNQKNRMFV